MALVASWLRRTPRLVRFLVVLLVAVSIPLTSAQAQTEETGDHVHIYVVDTVNACHNEDTESFANGEVATVRFCTQNSGGRPDTGELISWSIQSADGNATFVGTPEPVTAGLDSTRPGEAEALVRRTTIGSALIRGTWAKNGKSKSIVIEWGGPPEFDHLHLVTPGAAGTCEPDVPDQGAKKVGNSSAGAVHNVVACAHDETHLAVGGVPVFFETTNLGSASASTSTAVGTTDGEFGKFTFPVTSPTAGKTRHIVRAGGKSSNLYAITWTRAVDHVHLLVEGQGSCESSPATATVATGVTATMVACVHGAANDGIPSQEGMADPASSDPDTGDGVQPVSWDYAGPGSENFSPQARTNVNGFATATVRSETDGFATITAISGGRTVSRIVEFLTIRLTLTPAAASNVISTTHTVTATVVDSRSDPVPGTVVDFSAAGTGREGPSSGQRTTNAAGQTTFSFTSTATGISTITATVAAKSITATKTWVCPPFGGAYFPGFDIARDVALLPGESCKGYVLDGFGARHPFGGASATTGGPYFAGHDIARALVLRSDGAGGFVLDGFGALHPFDIGSPTTPTAKPSGGPYFPGQDIARDLNLIGLNSGYVLDGYGARHPYGVVTATSGGPYFPGNDIANAFAMIGGENSAGYVLDGYGARHAFNGAAVQTGGPYFSGFDIARDMVLTGASGGFVLDGFGARHPFGGQAATVEGPYFPGFDIARRLVLAPSLKAGIVVDGLGGLHQFFVP